MNVHIIYAHPNKESFTYEVLCAFIKGLEEAGCTYTLSDLYAMGFNPELSLEEYQRESAYRADAPLSADVMAEQDKLNNADVWTFIYPVWWTDCPAKLKGWFDRVWTVGFAYQPQTVKNAKKALVICAAGHTKEHLKETGCYQAMETTMLTDRIYDRAEAKEFILLGGSETLGTSEWPKQKAAHLERVLKLTQTL